MTPSRHARFWLYLRLEHKKYRSALPRILGGFFVILLLLTGCILLYQQYASQQQQKEVIHIGIVADPEEPYLDWMIKTVENMEGLKRSCQFTSLSAAEGKRGLESGAYTALFLIPHDYIHSLIVGKEAILRIQFGQGQSTIESYLIRDLADAASQIMLDTQAGIYAMDDYYQEKHIPHRSKDERSLNLRYLQKILNRKQIFTLEEVSGNTVTDPTHYFAVGILWSLIALGFTCPEVLRPEPRSLQDKLYLSGLWDWKRMLAKECALMLTFGSVYLILTCLLVIGTPWIPFLPDALHITASATCSKAFYAGMKLLALLPVLWVICGWILWIYEITKDNISSILLLFVSSVLFSFLSGYFYPLSYLPSVIQHLAPILPTGVMLNYSYHILSGIWHLSDLLALCGYGILLYGSLLVLARYQRSATH